MNCPHCRRGRRIASTYTYADITRDDSYCSWCGHSLPCLSAEEAAAEEQMQTPARVERQRAPKPMTKLADAARLSIEEMQRRLREKAKVTGYDHAKKAANDGDD